MRPLVSIITVTYNCADLLDRTFDSIGKVKDARTELIVVDGNSSDDTLTKIEKSSLVDKLLSEPDEGIFDAMNKGIKLASGEWLIFINAGDELMLKSFDEVDFQANQKSGVIFGNTIRGDGSIDKPYPFKLIRSGAMPVCHQSIFYNKEILGDSLYYDTSFQLYGENELMMRLDKAKVSVTYVDVNIAFFLGGGVSDQTSTGLRLTRYRNLLKYYGILGVVRGVLFKLGLVKFEKIK